VPPLIAAYFELAVSPSDLRRWPLSKLGAIYLSGLTISRVRDSLGSRTLKAHIQGTFGWSRYQACSIPVPSGNIAGLLIATKAIGSQGQFARTEERVDRTFGRAKQRTNSLRARW
jgi:hypothetical protein